MSYRFYAERVSPLGRAAGVAGTDKQILVSGMEGLRLTIPYLSFRCGATAQSLTVRQTENHSLLESLDAANDQITLEDDLGDLTGRQLVLEREDGTRLLAGVTATAERTHTLDIDLETTPLNPDAKIYLVGETDYEHNQVYQLDANAETILSQPAPGIVQARDFCYPLILEYTNTSNPATLQAGTVVFISR